jgi:hypothetical protein
MKHMSLALLLVLVGLTSASVYKARAIEILLLEPVEATMATLTTSWTSTNGTHTIVTTRAKNETAGEHAARHREDVLAAQEAFPPI